MDWFALFWSSVPTGVVIILGWLLRNVIATRLTNSVKHEFDAKLETLKAELQASQELLKADLRAKETELATLRGGAISAMASRQMAIDKRRLEAIDQLWDAFDKLSPIRNVAETMALYKFEAAAAVAARDQNMRKVFEALTKNVDYRKMDLGHPHKARPFVSPMAWAYFSAYNAIGWQAVAKAQIVRYGMPANFVNREGVANLVKAALPEHSAYIDQWGDAGYHHLLSILESRLLAELQLMLSDTEAYRANVEQAAQIVQQSNSLMESALESGAAQAEAQSSTN